MNNFIIPLQNNDELFNFYSKDNLHLATSYERIVIGKRGPYVEFKNTQIIWDNFIIPFQEQWRLYDETNSSYYDEYRSIDKSYVKLYLQKKLVTYADYKIGLCYISPFDLYLENKCVFQHFNNSLDDFFI